MDIIKPNEFSKFLLDEIKFGKPLATVKGAIWSCLGLVANKFPD